MWPRDWSMTEKSELRRRCRELARPDGSASRAICARILAAPVYQCARSVFAFYPMAAEPDIRPVLLDALGAGKVLYLPRSEPDGVMRALRVRSLEELRVGRYGICEPPSDAEEGVPELVLVPAVAFDEMGHRLGHGGGYYDRYLSGFTGHTLGVSFDALVLARVPREPFDEPVETIATERRLIVPGHRKGGLPNGGSV